MTSNFGDFPLVAHDLERDGVAWGYGPRRGVTGQAPRRRRRGGRRRTAGGLRRRATCWPPRAGSRASAGARGPVAPPSGAGAPRPSAPTASTHASPGSSAPRPTRRRRPWPAGTSRTGAASPPPALRDARPPPAPGDLRPPHQRPPVRRLRRLAHRRVPGRARRSARGASGRARPGAGSGRARARRPARASASTAAATCPTSCAGRSARGGPSSATPAATRTRSWRWASATLCVTPSFWRRPPAPASRTSGRSRRPSSATSARRNDATLPRLPLTTSAPRAWGPRRLDLARIRAAVRHRPQDATRLVLADPGPDPREAFFNPRNLQAPLGDGQLPEGAVETVRVTRSSGHSAQRGPSGRKDALRRDPERDHVALQGPGRSRVGFPPPGGVLTPGPGPDAQVETGRSRRGGTTTRSISCRACAEAKLAAAARTAPPAARRGPRRWGRRHLHLSPGSRYWGRWEATGPARGAGSVPGPRPWRLRPLGGGSGRWWRRWPPAAGP